MKTDSEKDTSSSDSPIPKAPLLRLGRGFSSGPILPGALSLVYFIVLLIFSLKYHPIGGYGVEADFYADFAVQAKKLLAGNLSVHNYGLKGPLYSIFLALFYLIFRDFFRAGLVLNILCAAGSLFVGFLIIRRLWGIVVACMCFVFCALSFPFLLFTYSVGTDMMMLLFSLLTIYFTLKKDNPVQNMVFAGFFSLLAFLTRYNAIFLLPGVMVSVLVLNTFSLDIRKRVAVLGVFLAVFIVAGSFWFIPNAVERGHPFYNDNIIVLKLKYFPAMINDPDYRGPNPDTITGLIAVNPVHVIRLTAQNFISFFRRDLSEIMPFFVGIVLSASLFLLPFTAWIRLKVGFFLFLLFHYLLLVFVHYDIRFAFMRLFFYGTIIFGESLLFTRKKVNLLKHEKMRPLIIGGVGALLCILLAFHVKTSSEALTYYRKTNPEPLFILNLADKLKAREPDGTAGLLDTKPHMAYYSGLRCVVWPAYLESLDELVTFCREHDAKYVLVTYNTIKNRPHFRFLGKARDYLDLKLISFDKEAVLYQVSPPTAKN